MPTASESSYREADRWFELANRWSPQRFPDVWADRPPTEKAVIVYFDPVADLRDKAARAGFELNDESLPSLAGFAAALARSEGGHWDQEVPDMATRVYEQRRFLVGDRIAHWAVPWLDAVGRCYPETREMAHADRDFLLAVADEMRIEPLIPGRDGLVLEGEDSYGRIEPDVDFDRWLRSLWSGHLLLDATWASLEAELGETRRDDLALLYEVAEHRWRGLADVHPGSAQIWMDLSARAGRTRDLLTSSRD